MTDFSLVTSRLFQLLLVPAMLVAPLLFVLLTARRVESEADRAVARARSLALLLATLGAVAVWLGLLIYSVRVPAPGALTLNSFSWVLFFPLWFLFGIPALRAKNPAWGAPHADGQTPVRTASLVNRSRRSPVQRAHWIGAGAVQLALLAALLLRGLQPFADDVDHSRWLVASLSYGFCLLVTQIAQPFAVRAALHEAEPLDAAGSPELAALYDAFRRTKILGLFWLTGVAVPVSLGGTLVLAAWVDWFSGAAVVGALVGTTLGLAGAWFGVSMSIRRGRIAEVRSRLDARSRTAPAD